MSMVYDKVLFKFLTRIQCNVYLAFCCVTGIKKKKAFTKLDQEQQLLSVLNGAVI